MSKHLFVGLARLELHIPQARSLKAKRSETRSLLQRLRSRHQVLVTEASHQDLYQRTAFAICALSTDEQDLQARMQRVRCTVEETWTGQILGWELEILEMENSQ
ncbi:MAG: DUF503 domain-containing protein [bacterium]|nr:DUF503 domain-containing protein [bacterium]